MTETAASKLVQHQGHTAPVADCEWCPFPAAREQAIPVDPTPLPPEPPNGTRLGSVNEGVAGALTTWERADVDAFPSEARWFAAGSGAAFTWAEAFAQGADPRRRLVAVDPTDESQAEGWPDEHMVNWAQEAAAALIAEADMRVEVVKREVNQGALAGMDSEIGDYAAALVVAALDSFDDRPRDYDNDPAALSWARAGIEHAMTRIRRFEAESKARGGDGTPWRYIRHFVDRDLLGGTGCVIGVFDERSPEVNAAIRRSAGPEPAERINQERSDT